MSTIFKNPLLCSIFIICVFVLLYCIFFHGQTRIVEGVTNMGSVATGSGATNPGATNPGATNPGATNPGATNPGTNTIGIQQKSPQEIIHTFKTVNPAIYAKIKSAQEKMASLTQDEIPHNTIRAINAYKESISGNKTCVDPEMYFSKDMEWSVHCGKGSIGGTNVYTNYCKDNTHLCDDKNLTPEEQLQRTTFIEKCGVGILGSQSVCYTASQEGPNYTPAGSYLTRSDKPLPTPGNDGYICTSTKDGQSTKIFSATDCVDNSHKCTWVANSSLLNIPNLAGPACIKNKYINSTNSSIINPLTENASGALENDDLYHAIGTIVNHQTTKNFLQGIFESLTGTNQAVGTNQAFGTNQAVGTNPLNPNLANGSNFAGNPRGPTNLLSMLQLYNNPNIQAGATGLSYPQQSQYMPSPINLPQPMTCEGPMTCGGSMPYPYNCVSTRIDF
jgi:hypothetical protein